MSLPIEQLPIVNGMYRIRNLEKDSYVGLANALQQPSGRIAAQQYSDRESDRLDQIWFFYHIGDNKYHIINTSSPSAWLGTQFTKDYNGVMAFATGKPDATEWSISKAKNGGRGFSLLAPVNEGKILALQISKTGSANMFPNEGNPRQLWEIVPAGASNPITRTSTTSIAQVPGLDTLSNGYYRVRNLNPNFVLTLSANGDNQPYGSKADIAYVGSQDNNMQQIWKFVRQDSGYYTICLHETQKYLGYQTIDPAHPLIKIQSQPAPWKLESAGGIGYILAVPDTKFAVGFADYRADPADKIKLVDNIRAHCQIWLCESWRTLEKDETYQPPPPEVVYQEPATTGSYQGE